MPKPPIRNPQALDVQEAFRQALQFHQQGMLEKADELYRAVLALRPDHFDALHFLGVLRAQQGRSQEAVELISRALGQQPYAAEAHFNLGNVLAALDRHVEAIASYDQALALEHDHAVALNNRGNALLALDRHEDALASFDRALAIKPDYADALSNRGNALKELNRHGEALASYDQALALRPDHANALNNRGSTLQALNRHDEALASYDKALALRPDHANALHNRGIALLELHRYEEALASYDRALGIEPDHVGALNNRGNALLALNRYEEALACYDRALATNPDFARALNNRGNALLKLHRYEEALASYDRTLTIRPDDPDALNNRGNALRELHRHEEALVSYNRALEINPVFADSFNNRGNALLELHHNEEALASYDRALAIQPDDPVALSNRGNALRSLNRPEEALASYDHALALKPDHHDALYNRGQVLRHLNRREDAARSFARLLELAPDYDFAKGDLLYAKMLCCDWRERDSEVKRITDDIRAGKKSIIPFPYLGISDSAHAQLQCSQIWVRDKHPASAVPVWKGKRYCHDRIRLAYLSADFRVHPSSFLLAGMFEQHDRSRFETTAVSFGLDDHSEIRNRQKDAVEHFIDVRNRGDRDVAHLVNELEIDIAVDLMGHTQQSRAGIFALRPCPVQVNYLAYPGTLGADYMDYILADRHVIPPEHEACYAEKIVYLPDTYQVNDSRRVIAERTPSRAEVGLPDASFVFCCFNNSYKITPEVFDRWMRLLVKVPGSTLWLLEDNAAASRNLKREAGARGVAPERLVFAPRMKLEDHLARHRLADLFLDTLPYNAHTTASDALWAGLPLVTCLGVTFAGRVAASLLNAVGLPELITRSLDEYESLAVELARNPKQLADIKAKLARNRGTFPLFDTDRFRRHIEAAYTTMWERHQRGEPPASFAVPAIEGQQS